MTILEALFFLGIITLLMMSLIHPGPRSRNAQLVILLGSVGVAVIPFAAGLRWQLLPALLVLPFLLMSVLAQKKFSIFRKVLRSVFTTLTLLISIFLILQFPISDLPPPSGTYRVGNFGYTFTDASRTEVFATQGQRRLFLNIWYPAALAEGKRYEFRGIWEELYSGDIDWIFLLTNYLQNIKTHSYIEAPVVANNSFPVLVYNHGLYSFTSQNLLLMEELASHGYIVVSIGHTYQSLKVNLSDSDTYSFQTGWPDTSDPAIGQPAPGLIETGLDELVGTPVSRRYRVLHEILEGFRLAESEAARRQLVSEINQHYRVFGLPPEYPDDYLYNYLATELNLSESFIDYWAQDIDSVLNHLPELNAPVADFSHAMDLSTIGVFGMSFGGAAAGEFCKLDSRCMAGSNIDGFQFGRNWNQPLIAPFLLIYSDALRGNTDWAYLESEQSLEIVSIEGSTHGDLTDFPRILRIMKLIGSSGEISPDRARELLNHLIVGFFDEHLKSRPRDPDYLSRYTEIKRRELHQ